jgi:hypothetical protein
MRRWLIELAKGETFDQMCLASYAFSRAEDYFASNRSIDAHAMQAAVFGFLRGLFDAGPTSSC